MTRLWILPALLAVAIAAACSSQPDALSIPEGSEVTLEKRDGVKVAGKLVEVQPQVVVVEGRDGARTRVPRTEIASVRAITTAERLRRDRRPGLFEFISGLLKETA